MDLIDVTFLVGVVSLSFDDRSSKSTTKASDLLIEDSRSEPFRRATPSVPSIVPVVLLISIDSAPFAAAGLLDGLASWFFASVDARLGAISGLLDGDAGALPLAARAFVSCCLLAVASGLGLFVILDTQDLTLVELAGSPADNSAFRATSYRSPSAPINFRDLNAVRRLAIADLDSLVVPVNLPRLLSIDLRISSIDRSGFTEIVVADVPADLSDRFASVARVDLTFEAVPSLRNVRSTEAE